MFCESLLSYKYLTNVNYFLICEDYREIGKMSSAGEMRKAPRRWWEDFDINRGHLVFRS